MRAFRSWLVEALTGHEARLGVALPISDRCRVSLYVVQQCPHSFSSKPTYLYFQFRYFKALSLEVGH